MSSIKIKILTCQTKTHYDCLSSVYGHHIGCYAGALGVAEVLQYASGQ